MLKSYISLLIVLTCSFSFATNNKQQNDTLNKFGIRAGIDIQKIIRSATNKEYNGLSINADIRIKKLLYISSEIGNEEKMTNTDYIRSTSKGNYIKVGTKFKLNKNLKGNQNLTYSGANLGYSSFNQTINSYTIYNENNSIWGISTINNPLYSPDLNALWFELIFGLKTEIFNNLFLGLEIQLKNILSETKGNQITNFYIPGFNRTFDGSSIGAGFSYTISYLIPVVKK
tara:strand:+ start:44 stop:730 length:687 start_codon:yes stop_codon:yes gene_type:complete